MKKVSFRILESGLAVLVAICLVTGCSSGAYSYEKIDTTGIVAAKDKDSAGKVKSVEIKTAEKSFIVEHTGKGKELLGMIDKKVDVSGKVRQQEGKKFITVESYKVVN